MQLNLPPLVLQENLPNLFLDGELWFVLQNNLFYYNSNIFTRFGRGTFVDSQKIASNSESIDWQHLR